MRDHAKRVDLGTPSVGSAQRAADAVELDVSAHEIPEVPGEGFDWDGHGAE